MKLRSELNQAAWSMLMQIWKEKGVGKKYIAKEKVKDRKRKKRGEITQNYSKGYICHLIKNILNMGHFLHLILKFNNSSLLFSNHKI